MRMLIIASPYEADRIRRAAVSAGVDGMALEPGDSLSARIKSFLPDVIVMAPKIVHPDPQVAINKIWSQPAGRVPTFLVGDPVEEPRLRVLGDGFFLRPVSPSDLVVSIQDRLAPTDEPYTAAPPPPPRPAPVVRPPATLSPLVAEPSVAADPLGALAAGIDANFEHEFVEAVRTVSALRRPEVVAKPTTGAVPASPAGDDTPVQAVQIPDDDEAANEFGQEGSHKTVEAPESLVGTLLATSSATGTTEAPRGPMTTTRGAPLPPTMPRSAAAPITGVHRMVVPPPPSVTPPPIPYLDRPGETVAALAVPRLTHGTLAEEDLPALLARVFLQRASGRLVVRHGGAEKTVSFDGGYPVVVTSNLPYDRMAEMLFREGKISPEQCARSSQIVGDTGRRMGAVLVDLGFLKMSELFPAVRRHYEEILYSLFGWEDGYWTFEPDVVPEAEKIRLSRHPAAIVLEGLRRKATEARLLVKLGSREAVYRMVDSPGIDLSAEAGLSAEERTAASLFDGTRSIAEVRIGSGVADEILLPVARGLLALGLLVPVAGKVGRKAGGRAEARDRGIDRERVLARFGLVQEGDYFELFGISHDATAHEARRAYEALKREFSTEVMGGDLVTELGREIAIIQKVLDEGLRVLGDDDLRARYRQNLRPAA